MRPDAFRPRQDQPDRSRHCRGRDAIRTGIAQAETTGLSGSRLLAILMSETLPRLVSVYGPANAALILTQIAHEIRAGTAPNTTRQ